MKNKMEKAPVTDAIKKLVSMSKEEKKDSADETREGVDLVSIAKKLSGKKFKSKK